MAIIPKSRFISTLRKKAFWYEDTTTTTMTLETALLHINKLETFIPHKLDISWSYMEGPDGFRWAEMYIAVHSTDITFDDATIQETALWMDRQVILSPTDQTGFEDVSRRSETLLPAQRYTSDGLDQATMRRSLNLYQDSNGPKNFRISGVIWFTLIVEQRVWGNDQDMPEVNRKNSEGLLWEEVFDDGDMW